MGLFDLAEVDIAAHSGFPEKFSHSISFTQQFS